MNTEHIDILQMIGDAGIMVQFVMLMLLFFSITSWVIIFLKFRYIRKAFVESDRFTELFWESRDFAVAFNESEALLGSPIARIFRVGYSELRKLNQSGGSNANGRWSAGGDNVNRALRRAINVEVTRMGQMVPFLATTGNTAPFIGLFGTVWGIMEAFHSIGRKGSASLAAVAPGISEALVATAAGLAVAIPAVIAYNYFLQKINVIESELQSFSVDFLNIVDLDRMNVKEDE